MTRPMYLIIFIFVTIIGLAITQVSTSNQLSTTGAELAKLEQQIDNYKKENTVLKEQVLETASLTNIEEKAEKLGFTDAKNQITLSAPMPLALKQ